MLQIHAENKQYILLNLRLVQINLYWVLLTTRELDLGKILRLASRRYSLNKESAINMVVEVLSKMAKIGVNKVHENNTGRVIDFKFFRRHVYDASA